MIADELYSRALKASKAQEVSFSNSHQKELAELRKMLEKVAESGLTKISFVSDRDNPVVAIELSGKPYLIKHKIIDFVLNNSKMIAKITGLKIAVVLYVAPRVTISFDKAKARR